jgi:drug/metabolite transporter (DMT)-like permease
MNSIHTHRQRKSASKDTHISIAATLLALITLALWSFLALLGASLTHIPPFFLVGMALCTSGIISLVRVRDWRVPIPTLLVGIYGIFGYHFLYFTALQLAPPIEASLVNYLWPLLIIILSPVILVGYRLRRHHIFGALLGFIGAGMIAARGQISHDLSHLMGYLIAAGAAFTWSSYSLLTKRLSPFPTGAVGGFCLASGMLSLLIYFRGSPSSAIFARLTPIDWRNLILLGAGPMGLAFFTWDAALKRGDPRIIGAMAYLTPLFSTINLIVFAGQQLTWVSGLAMILIIIGAIIGSLEIFTRTAAVPVDQWRKPPHN